MLTRDQPATGNNAEAIGSLGLAASRNPEGPLTLRRTTEIRLRAELKKSENIGKKARDRAGALGSYWECSQPLELAMDEVLAARTAARAEVEQLEAEITELAGHLNAKEEGVRSWGLGVSRTIATAIWGRPCPAKYMLYKRVQVHPLHWHIDDLHEL